MKIRTYLDLVITYMAYWFISKRCKIVLCGGMLRSGSTWLSNAVKLLLNDSCESIGFFWIGDFSIKKFLFKLRSTKVLVLKIHKYDRIIARHASVVLYSVRDIRDIAASLHRMRGSDWEKIVQNIDNQIKYCAEYKIVADYIMRYETMIVSPETVLNDLAKVLKVYDYDSANIIESIRNMNYFSTDNVNGKYNLNNLFHKEHITDGRYGSWKQTMPEAYIKLIENRFVNWFSENNYTI